LTKLGSFFWFFMKQIRRDDQKERWALILAGGDGTRLKPLTRVISGDDRPKQFCSFFGSSTLIEDCRLRVSLSLPENQTVTIVTRDHERYYKPVLLSTPDSQVLVQPRNKGTAPAIILGLLRIARLSHDATVAIFPIAHYIDDDARLMSYVEAAFAEAQQAGKGIILLSMSSGSRAQYFDSLKDSCVMVGRIDAFLRLAESEQPMLYERLITAAGSLGMPDETASIEEAYHLIPSVDFFDEIVAVSRDSVIVKELSDLGWWDLSEPPQTLLAIQSHLAGMKTVPSDGKAGYKTSISFLRMHYEGLAQSHRPIDPEPFL